MLDGWHELPVLRFSEYRSLAADRQPMTRDAILFHRNQSADGEIGSITFQYWLQNLNNRGSPATFAPEPNHRGCIQTTNRYERMKIGIKGNHNPSTLTSNIQNLFVMGSLHPQL